MMQPDSICGPSIQLVGGQYFDFTDPAGSEFYIEDIAHALSLLCRFTGHTRQFYSVAQHSVGVSKLVPYPLAMYGLLHDASEAFLGDVSSPLKALLPDYRDIESAVEGAVLSRFGIPRSWYAPHKLVSVRLADLIMLATERLDLMPKSSEPWSVLEGIKPLFPIIVPLDPLAAEQEFLNRFHYLIESI